MTLTLDLHSHSGYSGGVGQISLEAVAKAMALKGLEVFGTGDALHVLWQNHLKENLRESAPGLFELKNDSGRYFLLQTEIIVSFPMGKKRKSFHLLILFPDHETIGRVRGLLEKWGVKNTIGRPFLVCHSLKELSDRLFQIQEAHPLIEIIPAHVMTPQGVLGSENPVSSLSEAFGDFVSQIRMIETGLSADPQVLEMIPELEKLTFVSNSDTHSADLRRIGREFTVIETPALSYEAILETLRKNRVLYTGEFSVAEGRFFLTGHRKGKRGHEDHGIFFSPGQTPKNGICPECGKPLTIGVLERAYELSQIQGGKGVLPGTTRRKYLTLVPLLEVIAAAFNKTHTARPVVAEYHRMVSVIPETKLWLMTPDELSKTLSSLQIQEPVIEAVVKVRQGLFTYRPMGFDGSYGRLVIGEKEDLSKLEGEGI